MGLQAHSRCPRGPWSTPVPAGARTPGRKPPSPLGQQVEVQIAAYRLQLQVVLRKYKLPQGPLWASQAWCLGAGAPYLALDESCVAPGRFEGSEDCCSSGIQCIKPACPVLLIIALSGADQELTHMLPGNRQVYMKQLSCHIAILYRTPARPAKHCQAA